MRAMLLIYFAVLSKTGGASFEDYSDIDNAPEGLFLQLQSSLARTLLYGCLNVLRKSLEGDAELAVVGPCASGSAVSLRFRNVDEASLDENLPSEVNRLSRRLLLPAAIPPGSTRLVGQLQDSMPGMTITPDANQSSSQTILLAHLEHAPLPAARIDVNLIGDFRKALTDEDETDSDTSDEQEES